MESRLMSMPDDILVKILSFLGASDHESLFTVKQCCKKFLELASEDYVTRRMKLDRFKDVTWRVPRPSVKNIAFLERCNVLNHPDHIFKKAMGCNLSSEYGREKCISRLTEAADLGNKESILLLGMFLIEKGGENIKDGISFLNSANEKFKDWDLNESIGKISGTYMSIWDERKVVGPIPPWNCKKENHSENVIARMKLTGIEEIESCRYCKWIWNYINLM